MYHVLILVARCESNLEKSTSADCRGEQLEPRYHLLDCGLVVGLALYQSLCLVSEHILTFQCEKSEAVRCKAAPETCWHVLG